MALHTEVLQRNLRDGAAPGDSSNKHRCAASAIAQVAEPLMQLIWWRSPAIELPSQDRAGQNRAALLCKLGQEEGKNARCQKCLFFVIA